MALSFTKMHGLGNDFVVIDATRRPFRPSPEAARHLADRRRGVGCDQILVLEPASSPDVDFDYRIFNADGSESGQCGNGARCLALFARERGLSDKDVLKVRTSTGVLELRHQADGLVRVNMGVPRWEPREVPFRAEARADRYTVDAGGRPVAGIGVVSVGNPHAVIEVPDVGAADVEGVGRALQESPAFPESVNVGFLQVTDSGHAALRVYERGAGETLACGSGACAAAAVGQLWGRLGQAVEMRLAGGILTVEWAGDGQPVWMTGPAVTVYRGELQGDDQWRNATQR